MRPFLLACILHGRAGRFFVGLVLGGLAGLGPGAAGHDFFTAYVQHRAQLTVSDEFIDLTLHLTFFEEWSGRERRLMDANADSRIALKEVLEYVNTLAPQWHRQVRLLLAGQELALAPLYEPEIDLLKSDKAGPGHHQLRLFFFARTPANLRAGDEFVLENSLWPKAQALFQLEAAGRDGCQLEIEPRPDILAPDEPGEKRVLKARCVLPPNRTATRGRGPAS